MCAAPCPFVGKETESDRSLGFGLLRRKPVGGTVDRLSDWVVRHRLVVGLVWLAVTVVGVLLAPSVSGVLKSGAQLNSSAYTANQQIAKQYGGTTANPGVIVLDLPAGTTVTSAAGPSRPQAPDPQL